METERYGKGLAIFGGVLLTIAIALGYTSIITDNSKFTHLAWLTVVAAAAAILSGLFMQVEW